MQHALVVALRSISSLAFEKGLWGEARTQCLGQLWPWKEKRSGGHIYIYIYVQTYLLIVNTYIKSKMVCWVGSVDGSGRVWVKRFCRGLWDRKVWLWERECKLLNSFALGKCLSFSLCVVSCLWMTNMKIWLVWYWDSLKFSMLTKKLLSFLYRRSPVLVRHVSGQTHLFHAGETRRLSEAQNVTPWILRLGQLNAWRVAFLFVTQVT